MNSLGATITTILALLAFMLPPRGVVVVIIASTCYITQGQSLDIFGFDFYSFRIVLMVAMIRVCIRGELGKIKLNNIDRALIAYTLSIIIIPIIREGSVSRIINGLGGAYNVFLSYFVFRALLIKNPDFRKLLNPIVFALIPFALLMIYESVAGKNLFHLFGGVPEVSMIRDGGVRSQSAFRSPITAGSFGATFGMLFLTLIFSNRHRKLAYLGFAVSVSIVICAHSSGPLLGFGVGTVSLALWTFRTRTKQIRLYIFSFLVSAHILMKAPVWFLMARVSDVVGGGGWHRAALVDRFVNSFSSWWLVGSTDTSSWFATQIESGGADITNKFVSDGLGGGLIGLILSIRLFYHCFSSLGKSIKFSRNHNIENEKMLWGLGSTLVCTIAIFFSVTYFDQSFIVWYFLLACISTFSITQSQIGIENNNDYRNAIG